MQIARVSVSRLEQTRLQKVWTEDDSSQKLSGVWRENTALLARDWPKWGDGINLCVEARKLSISIGNLACPASPAHHPSKPFVFRLPVKVTKWLWFCSHILPPLPPGENSRTLRCTHVKHMSIFYSSD